MKSMQDLGFGKGEAMITQDEALTIGLRKYRDVFPPGTLPSDLEDAAVLTQIPGKTTTVVLVTFSLRGQRDPFVLFRATVSRLSGDVRVETAADWHALQGSELDQGKSL
jgi:hypothetical protein